MPIISQGTAIINCDFIFYVRPNKTTNDIIIFFIAFNLNFPKIRIYIQGKVHIQE